MKHSYWNAIPEACEYLINFLRRILLNIRHDSKHNVLLLYYMLLSSYASTFELQEDKYIRVCCHGLFTTFSPWNTISSIPSANM